LNLDTNSIEKFYTGCQMIESSTKTVKEILEELQEFIGSWYSDAHPNTSECYIDKGAILGKIDKILLREGEIKL